MDKGENEEVSLKDIKEVLSLFPEFAKKWQGKQDLAMAEEPHVRRRLRSFPKIQ